MNAIMFAWMASMVAITEALLLLVACINWRHWKQEFDRTMSASRMYLGEVARERKLRAADLEQIDRLSRDKRTAEQALEMEVKNRAVMEEHLCFYIETAADLEKLVALKDEELERLEQKQSDTRLGEALAELREVQARLRDLAADYENYREFSELRCATPGPFSNGLPGYDPRPTG